MFNLEGKVAIVTGSTRGIGRATARMLAQAGASVVVSGRAAESSAEVAGELRGEGLRVTGIACHVGRDDQQAAMVEQTIALWGRIDIVVCNAATNPVFGPISQTPEAVFDKVMQTNVRSNLTLCRLVCPGMAERGGGSVILMSSIAALRGDAAIGTYGVSKAAQASLARSLAIEWGPSAIRVNAIAPGLIKTDFARALWEDPERARMFTDGTPLRRIGEPEDIAGVALFLASDASRFVTGQLLVADGGRTVM